MYYVCLSAQGIDNVERQRNNWPYAELRMDLIKPTKEDLIKLLSNKAVSYIATCRLGDFDASQSLELLKCAAKNGADYVDIEIERSEEDIQALKEVCREYSACKMIVSYHNFDTTPDLDELDNIINEAVRLGADCVKIACQSNSEYDNAKLMSLYVRDENIIAFGMGRIGKITRLACVKCGSPITYIAPDDGTSTAPGQISLADVKSFGL